MQFVKKEFDRICTDFAKKLEDIVKANPGITGFQISITVEDYPEVIGEDFLRVVKVKQESHIII